ncbi:outer membrane protein [Labrys sp. LIt4]|uniref:outer membrane protein n=1 Tax=Labrys sp. LIt4 TaxID=2821355 RepID=UPI0032AFB3B7
MKALFSEDFGCSSFVTENFFELLLVGNMIPMKSRLLIRKVHIWNLAMRKFLIASSSFFCLTGAAMAADLAPAAVEPLAPVAVPFSWTGFYVGANAGYGWNNDDATLDGLGGPEWDPYYSDALGKKDLSVDGFVGGAQVGYNRQIGQFVVGVEADFNYSDMTDKSTMRNPNGRAGAYTYRQSSSIKWFGTVRTRVGYAFDRFLPYVTGGLSYGKVDVAHDEQFFGTRYAGSASTTKAGWTLGAGLEYAVTDAWTVKAEYLYFDLGEVKSIALPSPANPPFSQRYSQDVTGQIVRLGVNYKF